jgi:energy-coupling factor transporter ATP-binding protein EcfA2
MITAFKTDELGIGFDFDINLEADKQIYCFIGKNGIGKTQLLENMAKTLVFSHSMFKYNTNAYKYGNLFFRSTINEKLVSTVLKLPLGINLNGLTIKDTNINNWTVTSFEQIPVLYKHFFVYDKPIVYIGAKNRGFSKNIDSNNIKILSDSQNRFVDSFSRTLRYINGEGLEHEEIADWFASRLIINPNFVVNNLDRGQEAVTVLRLIDRLEPGLNLVTQSKDGKPELKLKFSEGRLLVNAIPLDKLSTGFISIIKIFQEIVAGYSGWTNEENLNEVDGVVFIDEIEPHLHISWQTKIIALLREFFPNTTFYISTHSPLVLSGLKDDEAYELYNEGEIVKAKTISHIENYFLNDIVKEFFGVDLNQERLNHVDKDKQTKAKKLLLDLVNTMHETE